MNDKISSNITFFGTPPFAVNALESILKSGRWVSRVVTQPPKAAGRGLSLHPSAVEIYAREHQIPVISPRKLRDPDFLATLKEKKSEVYVVVAYGRILPREVLTLPRWILNIHASLLPRWRGAAPIERALLAGDPCTGVSIIQLIEELDAGDVLVQREVEIGVEETAGELREKLSKLGACTLIETLDLLDAGKEKCTPQDPSQVTFAPLISVNEGMINWARKAKEINRHVRGYNPSPGAFTFDRGHRLKIHKVRETGQKCTEAKPGSLKIIPKQLQVATGDEWLDIIELQKEGKSRLSAEPFLSGYRPPLQTVWGVVVPKSK